MTGVCNTPHRADGIAEAISTGSCYIVLETSPPEYVQTISRYLESTVPQIDDTARNEPTESDSGDSVFVTQKPIAEPVRTGKRHHNTPTTPKDLEESEDDDLFRASPQESTTSKKKKKIRNHTLPKYIFPFIKEKQWMGRRTFLTGQQNTSLHNATMGGFFKCVRELWQGYKGAYMDVSLPTVDMDEGFISPLSEEEDGRSEDEDIKVVEKSFLAASKAKCSQPWYNPGKMDDHVKQLSRRRASNTSQDVSQRDRKKMTNKQGQTKSTSRSVTTATRLLSDTESLGGGYPCRDLPQRETGDKHEMHHTSILGQTETPKTKRRLTGEKKKILFQKSEREEELCNDSDATVCDPLQLQRSPREHTEGGNEAITTLMEAQADVLQMDDLNQTGQEEESQSLLQSLPQFDDSVCAESTRKKKKKKKAKRDHSNVEEGTGQSQEEPEGLHAAASVNMEAEETFSWLDKNEPKPPAMQTCDELENCMKKSTQEKTKRKKSKFIAENVRQEVGENLESGVRLEDSQASVMCNIENVDQVKKKKEKKGVEGVEQLQSPDAAATVNVNDDFDQRKKKEKVSTDKREDDGLENTEFSLGSIYKKKKRKHKSVKQSSPLEDAQVDDANGNLSNDGATVEEGVVKRKKRRESISEGVSYAPDTSDIVEYLHSQTSIDGSKDQDVKQLTKKKKRRDKMGEISNRQASEDTEILKQSDEAASVRKKEKKRTSSFLQADSEKIDDQQQNFRSKSVVAGVCDVDTESAEIYGGVSKKKKKKKKKTLATQGNVEEDHGTDFEEPNKMCGRVLTETGIIKKKKQKRSKSESVASMDRLDGAADEGQSRSDEDIMLKKTKKKKKKKCKEAM